MFRRISAVSFAAFSAIALTPAYAAESKPFAAPAAPVSAPAAGAANLLQVTLSLGLVLAAIFAAAWLMRRLRGFNRVAPGTIEILADVALGTKERAVLLQVGKQQLLVGVAPGRVNTLHVLETPVERQNRSIATDVAQAAASAVDFKQILKRSLGLR
jgi:flagellar biosynthetic protein FliO